MNKTNQSGKTSAISLIVLFFVIIGVGYFYPLFLAEQNKLKELNKARVLYTNGKWEATIKAYRKIWDTYPDSKGFDKSYVGKALEHLAYDEYPKTPTKDLNIIYDYYKEASSYGNLGNQSLWNMVQICRLMKKYPEALEYAQKGLKTKDKDKYTSFIENIKKRQK